MNFTPEQRKVFSRIGKIGLQKQYEGKTKEEISKMMSERAKKRYEKSGDKK